MCLDLECGFGDPGCGDAIATLVRDGDAVAIEGFTHLIPHAAGHEIIRQGKRDE